MNELLLALVIAAAPADYAQRVRPILLAAGCANGACHGSTLAPFKLLDRPLDASEQNSEAELTWKLSDAQHPLESTLLRKATGGLNHVGGKNLEPGSCEVAHIAAWMSGTVATCTLELRSRELLRGTQNPLPTELDATLATCATSSCHGGQAEPHFASTPNAAALSPFANPFAPTTSPLFKSLSGARGHPVSLKDPTSLPARALFSWMTGEPLAAPKRLPSLEVFRKVVMPVLNRRGCSQSACHGGVGSGLLLPPSDETVVDGYLRLLPRIAKGALWPKVTNAVAHGGGLGFSTKDDCLAQQLEAWLAGRTPRTCPPHRLPDEATYAKIVQPAFEQLKCTSCHQKGSGNFLLVPAGGDASTLHANYLAVQPFIDLDFPPVSHVLLRVREPCLQARIVAWVAGKPQPSCEVARRD